MQAHFATILGESSQLQINSRSQLKDVEEWMKTNKVECSSKTIQKSLHMRSIKHGFEIEFQDGHFYTFFAYFRTEKMGCFEFPLLFGINKGWTIKGAVMYLGQPLQKSNRQVEIIYPHLGVGLVFLGGWANQESQIKYAYLYPPEAIRVCAACGKKFEKSTNTQGKLYSKTTQMSRCRCQGVSYCCGECEKKHYGQHLIFCELGEL